jgi:phosphoribosylaminoimidazolecarboxamide formyltransferase / IMP cyclohydrolase
MTQQPRALISVSDKTGITELAGGLAKRGWALLSTGGTARALREAGLEVTDVATVTGHPEMMDGRVKTLHPAIHGGLLARRGHDEDRRAMEEMGYGPIDLVAVNLYPFRETIARGGISPDDAMEQVDIGGPSMLRSAAKNHRDVWAVVDPSDYSRILSALDRGSADGSLALRRELAGKVFSHTSAYDAAISQFLGSAESEPTNTSETAGGAPYTIRLEPVQTLRYGENPDQEAAFYRSEGASVGLASLEQLHGKELSYNNLLDLDGALLSIAPFAFTERPTTSIVKHNTPCGLAVGADLLASYRRALRTDPSSSFGSVIAVNRPLDADTAEAMSTLFIECLVAPAYADEALAILTKKKNVRILRSKGLDEALPFEPTSGWWRSHATDEEHRSGRFLAAHGRLPRPSVYRSVYGGALVQSPPLPPFYQVEGDAWKVATDRQPTAEEWDDLRFAWAVVFGVKSNAIVLAKDGATLGLGAGQMSRVDSSRIAVRKAADAGLSLQGCALASDAYFPFRDGVDAAAEAGATCIVQPGGSLRDDEVIQAANEHGLAMVFTGRRLFRH